MSVCACVCTCKDNNEHGIWNNQWVLIHFQTKTTINFVLSKTPKQNMYFCKIFPWYKAIISGTRNAICLATINLVSSNTSDRQLLHWYQSHWYLRFAENRRRRRRTRKMENGETGKDGHGMLTIFFFILHFFCLYLYIFLFIYLSSPFTSPPYLIKFCISFTFKQPPSPATYSSTSSSLPLIHSLVLFSSPYLCLISVYLNHSFGFLHI